MAEKEDPTEKALEDLLEGLAAPAEQKKPAAAEQPKSASARADSLDDKMSEIDEMAAGLQELLSSASIAEKVEAVKAEEEIKASEEKESFEDMESALASALSTPPAEAEVGAFDKIGEIEEVWEEEGVGVGTTPAAPVETPVDFSALAQAPAATAVEEVVVVEPEKLSEKRKRFYAKTFLGVAAAFLVAYLAFSFGIQPALERYYFYRLEKAVIEKRYVEADQYLLRSEGFGMTVEKYMRLSDIALAQRDLPRSLGYANKSFDISPAYIPTMNRIANIYLLQGRLDEAEKQARQSTVANPNNLEGYVIQAGALYRKGEIAKAQKFIADVLTRNRDYVSALELLRDIYIDLKSYQQALALQQKLTSIKKDIPEAQRFLDLGKIYYAAGRYSAAVGVLKDAYERDPTLWEAGYYLAKSLAGLGSYLLAAEQITRTIEESPSPTLDMYYLRALSHFYRNDIYTSLKELQRIRTVNPKYAPHYMLMGRIYIETYGEYQTGLKLLLQAMSLGYKDPDIYRPLGDAHFALKHYRDALSAWNPLLADVSPTDPFLYRISSCLIHLGHLEMAQAILMRMYSSGSRATAIFNNLGVIHELQGRRDAALRFYFQATEKSVLHGLKDSRIPKKNFDRLISGQTGLDIDESLLLSS